MRDKLIELIVAGRGCPYNADKYSDGRKLCQRCKYNIDSPCWAGVIADHLIANGVTFAGDNNFGKWIPVSEALPDPRYSIEMYFPSKEMVCLGFLEKVAHLDIWCVYTPNAFNVCQIKPTHWRYRAIIPASPEPPKEGEA